MAKAKQRGCSVPLSTIRCCSHCTRRRSKTPSVCSLQENRRGISLAKGEKQRKESDGRKVGSSKKKDGKRKKEGRQGMPTGWSALPASEKPGENAALQAENKFGKCLGRSEGKVGGERAQFTRTDAASSRHSQRRLSRAQHRVACLVKKKRSRTEIRKNV